MTAEKTINHSQGDFGAIALLVLLARSSLDDRVLCTSES